MWSVGGGVMWSVGGGACYVDDSYGPERRSVLMSGVAEEVRQLREAVADLQNNVSVYQSCITSNKSALTS